ncbi:MAG TPA: hypothetical protein VK584_04765, partial [Streptosporangiaceae bacterium]|nr:hypothetical protein [Streptosporangiaceae bacterium]
MTSNDGSSSNSTSATSGAPEPAFSALVIATYWGLPAPTSSWVTQMFGCVLLNSVTARPIPGTQAQNKTLVALGLHEPATTVTVGLALAVLAGELVVPPAAALLLLPPLLHAASSEMAAAPATAMVILRVLD